jgi:predicted amidophosphoribosyltransferase
MTPYYCKKHNTESDSFCPECKKELEKEYITDMDTIIDKYMETIDWSKYNLSEQTIEKLQIKTQLAKYLKNKFNKEKSGK